MNVQGCEGQESPCNALGVSTQSHLCETPAQCAHQQKGTWLQLPCYALLCLISSIRHNKAVVTRFLFANVVNAFGHLGCLSAFLLPPFQQHFLLGNFRITPSFTFSHLLVCCQPLFFIATSESHCLSCFLICC